jgi:hypothetical protein
MRMFPLLFQSVRSFAGHAVTLPPDGNNATGDEVTKIVNRGQAMLSRKLDDEAAMRVSDSAPIRSDRRSAAREP